METSSEPLVNCSDSARFPTERSSKGSQGFRLNSDTVNVPISLELKYVLRTTKLLARHLSVLPRMLGGADSLNRILRDLYVKNPVSLVRTHDFDIYLDSNDLGISPSIGVLGWHELRTTELFEMLIRRGSTVVDIGANVGYFTLLAARLAGEDGVVISFEPDPTSFSLLEKSVLKNRFGNVRLSNKCVSNLDGTRLLHFSITQNKGLHSISKEIGGPSLEVSSTRLDTALESLQIPRIDLLKIDVEGAEPEVIEGARRLLRERRVRNVIMEWDNSEKWTKHRDLLESIFRDFDVYRFARSVPFVSSKKLTLKTANLFNGRFGANLYMRLRHNTLP